MSAKERKPIVLPGAKYPTLVSDCLIHKPNLTGGNSLHVRVKIHGGEKPHDLYFTRDHLSLPTHELYKVIDGWLIDVGRYLSHKVHGIVQTQQVSA